MKKVIFRYKIIQPRKNFIRVKVPPCLHLQVESTIRNEGLQYGN
jgi:ribosomal protein S27E